MFKPNSVILYVDDVSVSTAFYMKILKQEPMEIFQDFTVFALTEGFILGLQSKHAIDPAPTMPFGGFELCLGDVTREQVDAIYQEWMQNQIPVVMSAVELDFGYTFVAVDPDGHRLRVCATDTANLVWITDLESNEKRPDDESVEMVELLSTNK